MLHGLDSVTTTEDTAHHTAILFSQRFYTKRALLTEKLLHREVFTESKLLYTETLTQQPLHGDAFTHSKLLHRENSTQSKLSH